MEQRNFGTTGCQVAAIGQGTWYIDRGDRATRSTPCVGASTWA